MARAYCFWGGDGDATIARVLGICLAATALLHCMAMVAASEVSDFLMKNGLPGGLLPSSVSNYSIHPDGSFQVELLHPCYAKFENLIWYDKLITGKIAYGKVDDLQGIQAEEFFVWLSVSGIRVDIPSTGFIYFTVGFVTKRLPAALFDAPPACRAGSQYDLADQPYSVI